MLVFSLCPAWNAAVEGREQAAMRARAVRSEAPTEKRVVVLTAAPQKHLRPPARLAISVNRADYRSTARPAPSDLNEFEPLIPVSQPGKARALAHRHHYSSEMPLVLVCVALVPSAHAESKVSVAGALPRPVTLLDLRCASLT